MDGCFIYSVDISSAYDRFKDAVERSLFCDPLIIDMAGDGLELDSWQAANDTQFIPLTPAPANGNNIMQLKVAT